MGDLCYVTIFKRLSTIAVHPNCPHMLGMLAHWRLYKAHKLLHYAKQAPRVTNNLPSYKASTHLGATNMSKLSMTQLLH